MSVMMWHPKTGERGVFADADTVPAGWLDHHPDAAQPVAEEVSDDCLSREEIVTALQEGGVEFSKNARTASLDKQLRTALVEDLHVDDSDPRTTRELLSAATGV